MSDKRTVATDALDTLGTVIDDKQKRDAIHLAVEPVVAGEDLVRGQYLNVVDGVARSADRSVALGIVDPFLHGGVRKGERFWFVMKPREVRSLRHVWSHPDFPDEAQADAKKAAEAWLRAFCDRANCPSLDRLVEMLHVQPDEYGHAAVDEYAFHISGTDAYGEIPPEFWGHLETYTGRKFPHHPDHFSCSC